MTRFRHLILMLLTLAVFTQSAHCQENDCQENDCQENDCQGTYLDDYSVPAYCAGAQAAHWSAYVPIGVLIVAAVWLGFSDNQSNGCCSDWLKCSYSDSYCFSNCRNFRSNHCNDCSYDNWHHFSNLSKRHHRYGHNLRHGFPQSNNGHH